MFKSDYYGAPEILSPEDGMHYFFGYYDMRACSEGRHLALRVPFMDRLPEAEDEAEIGYLKDQQFFPVAKTTAWNFQQAAMLQWHPFEKDTIYYNAFLDGKCVAVTHHILTGAKKYAEMPAACISPCGRWGLSVNFGRIYDFRPGYGYAGCPDPFSRIDRPEEDGVFLLDMESGKAKLLFNYQEIGEKSGFAPNEKILVNHITFDPTSRRFCMLVRNFIKENGAWGTSLMMGDLKGNLKTVLKKTYVSHYIWQDATHLIAHCTVEGEEKLMARIDMEKETFEKWDMPYFHRSGNGDIHCNILPGSKYVIGDGYPKDGYRCLMAYHIETGKERELFRCKTDIPQSIDVRCDLHARFINDGKEISFDTTMNGMRQIAKISAAALDF